jgi:hypothetical protein
VVVSVDWSPVAAASPGVSFAFTLRNSVSVSDCRTRNDSTRFALFANASCNSTNFAFAISATQACIAPEITPASMA